jgi:hypothetical protein
MQDKTPIYMLVMVAVVAIIGLIVVLTHNTSPGDVQTSDGITANVVASSSSTGMATLNGFGKIFFVAFMLGIVAYLYFRQDY